MADPVLTEMVGLHKDALAKSHTKWLQRIDRELEDIKHRLDRLEEIPKVPVGSTH